VHVCATAHVPSGVGGWSFMWLCLDERAGHSAKNSVFVCLMWSLVFKVLNAHS